MTTLRVQPEAQEQVDAADDWWGKNRPAAPNLFADEFDAALDELLQFPELGRRADIAMYPTARKRVLQETGYVLYYTYDRAEDHLDVVAVWSTYRGRGPFD